MRGFVVVRQWWAGVWCGHESGLKGLALDPALCSAQPGSPWSQSLCHSLPESSPPLVFDSWVRRHLGGWEWPCEAFPWEMQLLNMWEVLTYTFTARTRRCLPAQYLLCFPALNPVVLDLKGPANMGRIKHRPTKSKGGHYFHRNCKSDPKSSEGSSA